MLNAFAMIMCLSEASKQNADVMYEHPITHCEKTFPIIKQ